MEWLKTWWSASDLSADTPWQWTERSECSGCGGCGSPDQDPPTKPQEDGCVPLPRYLKIDHAKPMCGQLKPYAVQLVVCERHSEEGVERYERAGKDWPAKLKKASGIEYTFMKEVQRCVKNFNTNIDVAPEKGHLRAVLCDEPSKLNADEEGACELGALSERRDVLVFGSVYGKAVRLSVRFDDLERFVGTLARDAERGEFTPIPIEKHYVFVCGHAKRDKRCKLAGDALLKAFASASERHNVSESIVVRLTTHVGGHKFAGNVLVFEPNNSKRVSGHWLGRVTAFDADVIVRELVREGRPTKELWRGVMGWSSEAQAKCLAAEW